MVRTKSSEQAKKLAAKELAKAERKAGRAATTAMSAPKRPSVHQLGDPRPGQNALVEEAEDLSRAKTIAQTRKGAMVAATLCRTDYTESLQGTSDEVASLLGAGGTVPRKGWLGCMVPNSVRADEAARFEIKEPLLPRPLRSPTVEPATPDQDQDSLDAAAPTATAPPAPASVGGGGSVRLRSVAEGAGSDEGRVRAGTEAPSFSATGSSADHADAPAAPSQGNEEAEEPWEELPFVLPAGSLRSKWSCGGELGLCPGCVECIEDHPDRVRRTLELHSTPPRAPRESEES